MDKRIKAVIDTLDNCEGLSNYLTSFMREDCVQYAQKFILRAYQMGLETGVEAKKEFDQMALDYVL